MNIALMRSRITIQHCTATTDAVGNHQNTWTNYHTCFAYANLKTGNEYEAAGETLTSDTFEFTVRYCTTLASMDSNHYRILFDGDIYNITKVDDYQLRHRTLKLTAERVMRE